MITFKQFLAEAANYPLYHGTTVDSLASIIKDNKMNALYPDSHRDHPFAGKGTISMSRSKKFANYWGKRVDWSTSILNNYTPTRNVVIEFDREKLFRNYRILPYHHFPHQGTRPNKWLGYGDPQKGKEYKSIDSNQYEERVPAPISNINRYIRKIYLSKENLDRFKDKFPEEYDIIKNKIEIQ